MSHEDEQAVLSALTALARESAHLEAPPDVEQAVLRAFRARPQRRARPRWWLSFAAAAAAGLALAAWFGTREPELEKLPGVEAALHFSPPVVKVPVARPAPKLVRRPERAEPRAEFATDFLPLRPAPPLGAGERLQVVRVLVPRTEMLRFGLPVAPEPRDARVKADVVLGEDGFARAIRFVR